MALHVAVLTLTRDRLGYTEDCFARLRELAGISFDHYILDQGSRDGTMSWLVDEYRPHFLRPCTGNIGIHIGMNELLHNCLLQRSYDVIVKFDNDCLLQTEGALRDCAEVAAAGYVCSPRIEGLNHPPQVLEEMRLTARGHRFGRTGLIGGIFTACPASLFQRFRYDENAPPWGEGEPLCQQGFWCGYLLDHTAWHIDSTQGQHQRYPEYFAQKRAEGCPC